MLVDSGNNPNEIFENHFSLRCPHCGENSNMSAVSIPRYEYLVRFKPRRVGVCYRCDGCNEPVFLRFDKLTYDVGNSRIIIPPEFQEVERPSVSYEFELIIK